ncbi:MAG: hypothetical protein RMK18_11865 [Armatimonadota bacterium]|nr:hypothetical protein [Armatimonadota bacterium]MCX7778383.1 hypothetical protein [Armatimonadota bacterium]MDW8026543.1 hypothetical protein [Armatimonadota bacterium]
MALRDIIGNAQAIKMLKRACATNMVAHAYAFCGPMQVGKQTAALQFAKALNCLIQASDEDGADSCDTCESCRRIDLGTSLDVQLIAPTQSHGYGDEARGFSIRIDEMRRMRSDAMLSARHSRFKVYIVDNAELATEEAANCILKTLEEPSPNVVIILVTANPTALPRTVISRCQVVRFRLVPVKEIAEALVRMKGINENEAMLYARLSYGRPGLAFAYANSEEAIGAVKKAFGLLNEIMNAQLIDAIRLPEQIIGLGAELSALLPTGGAEFVEVERRQAIRGIDMLLECARDALAIAFGMHPYETTAQLINEMPASEVATHKPQRLARLIDTFMEARKYLLLNANVQLALETALLQFIGFGS